jgi:transcriptional regulator with XRE-family HTH domain
MSKLKTLHSVKTQKLCKWLISERKAKGLSIRGLAELLGWPPSILGKIETGDRRLDVIEYIEICEALDVDPAKGLECIATNKATPYKGVRLT